MRTETDSIGSVDIPEDRLWGIHTQRALENFGAGAETRRVPFSLIAALVTVKRAAAEVNLELGALDEAAGRAVLAACGEILDGGPEEMARHFPLNALQGGAGTSTNMNVNEVIANLALRELGKGAGAYDVVHPIDHVNRHQSTNDVYPTALRIAAIQGVRALSEALATLQGAFQDQEKAFHAVLKTGRTEMQPAVPMTLGQEFSAFAEAMARDRWRTFKCEERLRLVNIGGTAIGTGITAPRTYIFRVIEVLRALTGMGLARNENVIDGTANADAFVEVSGILKACAASLSKIAGDLRLLHMLGELCLPALQAGSSIMPGKVNPVMSEHILQIALAVRANDMIIGECAAHGTLQINEFMPMIASALLESIDMLTNGANVFAIHIKGIEPTPEKCRDYLDTNPETATAFVADLGYEKVQALVKEYQQGNTMSIRDFLTEKLGAEAVERVLCPARLTKLGD